MRKYIAESITMIAGHFGHESLCQLHTEQFYTQLTKAFMGETSCNHCFWFCYVFAHDSSPDRFLIQVYCVYGTWHEKLQTTARKIHIYPRRQSADSARTLRGFRTDNQRIPCGTISKFYSYNDILNDPCGVFLDLLALFRTKFAFWFPPFSNRIRTEDSCPSARKLRGARAENPRRSARNNHRIPRKKLSFPCHVPYMQCKIIWSVCENRSQKEKHENPQSVKI